MAKEEQGTGKHPHKSAEEPFPHTEGKSKSSANSSSHDSKGETSKSSSDSSDLKEREYTDAQGNVHHHTHTSGQHSGKK